MRRGDYPRGRWVERAQDMSNAGIRRRLFLKLWAGAAFLVALPSWVRAVFVESLQVRTVEADTFRFDPGAGLIRWTDSKREEPYFLTIDGLVEKPLKLSYNELKSLPQVHQTSDFHCVEGWSVKDIQWGGFRFGEIIRKVKAKPEAKYVVFHSLGKTSSPAGNLDHYVESFSIEELLDSNKERLLALSMNGKPLSHDHGAPLRVVSPYDLAYKGSKFVTRVEFTSNREPGWWTLANPIYPSEAPVLKNRLRKN
ncbi:MAG TPA: molybdopterin-dependent oxidoreductase [Syntrophorhabdales bacterium]|nr:molybdopterin-dependent oxidoreductase [Syntrophorhabdales bacterium]